MFRLLRYRKNLPPLGAQRYFTARASQSGTVHIQQVTVRRRRFKLSNVLIAGSVYMLCYELYSRAVLDRWANWLDEIEEELTEEELKEIEEQPIEPIFIPFPGFTKKVQPAPYRRTDPEWQAYVRVSQDEELTKSIRWELADKARRAVSSHPVTKARYGSNVSVDRYWLVFQYPYRPFPVFRRQGISIGGPGGIEWAEQRVDSKAVNITKHALWPEALALSLWSFTSSLVTQNATMIAKKFGYETKTDAVPNMQQAMERFQQIRKQEHGKSRPDSSPLPIQDRTSGAPNTSSLPTLGKRSAGSAATPETLPTGAGINNEDQGVPRDEDLNLIDAMRIHMRGPWDNFKTKLAQKWKSPNGYPPQGAIHVTGLVELRTQEASIMVDCSGWWDPKTSQFDRGVKLELRAVRPYVQGPAR